jgi:amidase
MAAGKLTSEKLTKEYIERMIALDQNGPGGNSAIELNPDALIMAPNADKLRKSGIVLGPLHGIPVLSRKPTSSRHGRILSRGQRRSFLPRPLRLAAKGAADESVHLTAETEER